MTISQRIQEHEDFLLSSAGNKPLSLFNGEKIDHYWSSIDELMNHYRPSIYD